MMSDNQPYFNAVKFLEGLIPAPGHQHRRDRPDIFIKRTRALLKALDYQFGKTKFIHITGTAGKGSTANVIYQLLLKNDQRVGLFTSPFVTTTIERIAANGQYIAPSEFAKLTEGIKPAITFVSQNHEFGCPSYFECLLAIALIYFQQENCQYQIIEVGIGGRFDSTNIIPVPVVAAITNIGLDHTEVLGKTLIEIASDKAGIIKQCCQFFTTEKRPELLSIFKTVCRKQHANYHKVSAGRHSAQETNYLLGRAVVQSLGFEKLAPLGDIRPLPARFEVVSQNPRVVIDVAHNPAKMRCTALNLSAQKYRHCHLVISLSANKKIPGILKEIAPYAASIYVTSFRNTYRTATIPSLIAEAIKKFADPKTTVVINPDPVAAFKQAQNSARQDDLILVTGSFYLADNIRSVFVSEEEILESRAS
ncbi:MAG: Mur ligase family protein [Candidatus Berkelbacteria bacterium]|nr:Mur ligase family protein [Candidatus Berkelbacteria bacterium]MCR4307189.1 Mur ligase family protein [Candidatus Berkelbacteria bacterium]